MRFISVICILLSMQITSCTIIAAASSGKKPELYEVDHQEVLTRISRQPVVVVTQADQVIRGRLTVTNSDSQHLEILEDLTQTRHQIPADSIKHTYLSRQKSAGGAVLAGMVIDTAIILAIKESDSHLGIMIAWLLD